MLAGLNFVYLRTLVRHPRSNVAPKSLMALFKNPACRASSLAISENPLANKDCFEANLFDNCL